MKYARYIRLIMRSIALVLAVVVILESNMAWIGIAGDPDKQCWAAMGDFRPLQRVMVEGARFQPVTMRGSVQDACVTESECDPPNDLFTGDAINPYKNVSGRIGFAVSLYAYLSIVTIFIYLLALRFKGTKGILGYLN